jgi:hypothetical protein
MMIGKYKDGNKQRVKILDFICDYWIWLKKKEQKKMIFLLVQKLDKHCYIGLYL